ncbi:MAG: Asp-tRNA(Asn)/Glu-tRNA(Gln) amidotransferase subunit GatC [Candidatus Omnitrophica bacterium]|nr:Asp-tRNA(Asn)/Glu-tRNA(Gln) amidotransferase subunit GatC [Candidatus Omnitrophota bacterium]MCK4423740.1 Asp-tRNA(Asn)/Glu-tRNA(Gln) amidotransferase subunit GatC [Candidatus Omnitrophota bacterium]
MAIEIKDVEYTAKLARIDLSAEEKELFAQQLDRILEYINKLNEVDTSGVEPTTHVLPLKNVYREDKVQDSLPVDKALQNAPEKEGDFFKVPQVIE